MSPFYLLAKFGHFVCWKGILEILRSFACIVQQANCIYGCRWLCNLHSFNIYIHLRLYCVPFSPFSPAIVSDLLNFPHVLSPRPKWKLLNKAAQGIVVGKDPLILQRMSERPDAKISTNQKKTVTKQNKSINKQFARKSSMHIEYNHNDKYLPLTLTTVL